MSSNFATARLLRGVARLAFLVAVVVSGALPAYGVSPLMVSPLAVSPMTVSPKTAAPAVSPMAVQPQLAGSDTPLTGVSQVSAGEYHACALLDNGIVQCWGKGAELGAGMVDRSAGPLNLDAPTPMRYTQISGKGATTCGITFDLKVECTHALYTDKRQGCNHLWHHL